MRETPNRLAICAFATPSAASCLINAQSSKVITLPSSSVHFSSVVTVQFSSVVDIRTGEGWLYLATVIDLWSRSVAGWAMGPTVNADLVIDALVMAFERRRPDHRVVHHSDRGAVYTSLAFSQRVIDLELDQSFGGVGSCYDNAAVESFFATLKRELAWIHETKTWPTRATLRAAIFDYIETFYNPQRIQQRLGYQSPPRVREGQRRLTTRVH